MTPRDWFVLAIRVFGLWQIPKALDNISNFTNLRLGLYPMSTQVEPNGYLLIASFDLALAAFFLFGAAKLASWCEESGGRDAKSEPDVEIT